jgi:hypothetical protein
LRKELNRNDEIQRKQAEIDKENEIKGMQQYLINQITQQLNEAQERAEKYEALMSEHNELLKQLSGLSAAQVKLGGMAVVGETMISCANRFKNLRDNDLTNLVFSMTNDDVVCEFLSPLISSILRLTMSTNKVLIQERGCIP